MNRMLVIGIGSIIMSDDGIGVRIVEEIQDNLNKHNIKVLVGETDVQYCISEIRADDFLVIIDAVIHEKKPGNIEILSLFDAMKSHVKLHSQHDFSLIDALSLNYPDIRGYFIGIEAAKIEFGFELSDVLRKRFNSICNNVFDAIIKMKEEAMHA